jgi:hypothetical protein
MNLPVKTPILVAGPAFTGTPITIIYEDRATGLRAKSFSDRLALSLGEYPGCRPACWRSELIELPEIAAEISRDADASEFVILSLRGDTGLSMVTKQWIEAWLERSASSSATLISLFDPMRATAAHAGSIRYYLRDTTAHAGVPFFAHCALTEGNGQSGGFPQHTDRSPSRRSRRIRGLQLGQFYSPALAA